MKSSRRKTKGDRLHKILDATDAYGSRPEWPYDIVSLDYSGGLFYADAAGKPTRLEAIGHVFRNQLAGNAADFLFLLSFNLHKVDQREITRTFDVIRRDLQRFGHAADQVIDAYLKHPKDQARLKVYVMYLIDHLAVQVNYETESDLLPIFYRGNRSTEMMAFRFYLKKSIRTFAPRLPKQRLNQIINRRMIEIIDGKQINTTLGLPLLNASR